MQECVIYNVKRVEERFGSSDIKKYLDSFKLECQGRNLTDKSIDVYYERPGYFFRYLQDSSILFPE